jgi:hypothetical protein
MEAGGGGIGDAEAEQPAAQDGEGPRRVVPGQGSRALARHGRRPYRRRHGAEERGRRTSVIDDGTHPNGP